MEGHFFTTLIRWTVAFGFLIVPLICSKYFQDHFTVIKWHSVHVVAFATFFLLVLSKKVRLPRFSGHELVLVIGLIIFSFINLFVHRPLDYHGALLDRLAFLALFIVFYNLFYTREIKFQNFFPVIFLATFLVEIYAVLEMFQIYELYPYAIKRASSFFGNNNMVAQFLGISIVCQVYYLFRPQAAKLLAPKVEQETKKKGKKRKKKLPEKTIWQRINYKYVAVLCLFIFTCGYLNYLSCRSVILASVFSLGFLLYRYQAHKKWKKTLGVGVAILFMCYAIYQVRLWKALPAVKAEGNLITKLSTELSGEKDHSERSMSIRLGLWWGSLKMFLDNPLGVGTSNYSFNFLPYQRGTYAKPMERVLYSTPHNEYVRYLVEDGILFWLMGAMFIFLIMRKFLREQGPRSDLGALIVGLSLYFLVESFFQFPFMNAFPFYVSCAFWGLIFSYTNRETLKLEYKAPSVFAMGSGLMVGGYLIFANIGASFYIANTPNNLANVTWACENFPSRWLGCMYKNQKHVKQQKYSSAISELENYIQHSPYNYVALKILVVSYFQTKNPQKGCYYLWLYDHLFEDRSSLHSNLMKTCPKKAISHYQSKFTP